MFKRTMKIWWYKFQVKVLARRIRYIQNMLLEVEHQKRLVKTSIRKIYGIDAEVKNEKELLDILETISKDKTSV